MAFTSGVGGALVFLAIAAALTGLYVLATGRRSWAWLPAKRRAGAIALAVSFALFIGGAAALPRTGTNELEAASSDWNAARRRPPKRAPRQSVRRRRRPLRPRRRRAPRSIPTAAYALANGASATAPKTQPAFATKAIDLLATLPIKGRAPKTGYDRALFGQAWMDVDRNGCDTRNDTLKRDLTGITYTNSVPCKVQSGTLADPYTGTTINFLRGVPPAAPSRSTTLLPSATPGRRARSS